MEGKQATPRDSSTEHHQVVEINDDEWIEAVTMELNKCRPRRQFQKRCTIFKVPEDIRKCDKEGAYDPVVVAIGPYHHGLSKDTTVTAMQDHKWDCVRRLLSRRTKSSSEATDLFGSCLLKMKEMDGQVRDCYSGDLRHLSPHDLAMIMLLDGCFIIHLLLKFTEGSSKLTEGNFKLTEMVVLNEEHNDTDEEESMAVAQEMVELDVGGEKLIDGRLEGMGRISLILVYDLLKLENQIPFFIVCKLFDILKTSEDGEIDLVTSAYNLLQFALASDIDPEGSPAAHFGKTTNAGKAEIHHLLHLFHLGLKPSAECDQPEPSETGGDMEWIPTATELQLAGIKFKRNKKAKSFLDISFKNNGTIKIPQLNLDDFTNTLFKNLIAFEQCSADTSKHITSYTLFMDYIINTSRDVHLLELKGILVNLMGTDDAAASLINGLGEKIIHDPNQMYLRGLHRKVKSYYNSSYHKQRARLIRDYFSSPWAILSFLAALILLLLTAEQSFFSAYSYFRPSP
ncbi:hypothetical protein DsansV1_C03g0029531 [Dioscorea sansibarensis]